MYAKDRVTMTIDEPSKFVVLYYSFAAGKGLEIICPDKDVANDVSKGLELLQKMKWYKSMTLGVLDAIEKFEKEAEEKGPKPGSFTVTGSEK